MIKADPDILQKITSRNFDKVALEVFKYQSKNNPVYAKYLDFLGINPTKIGNLKDVPFMPIELFKSQVVKTGKWKEKEVFLSSGTGGIQSRHFIKSLKFYRDITELNFTRFFGRIEEFELYALLPGYVNAGTNSLVTMISSFIRKTNSEYSGFYMGEEKKLKSILSSSTGKKRLLFGVSHALLEFAQKYPVKLKNTMVMETGGMKGKREEITREELHDYIIQKLGVNKVYSEYGMAELTSQGYSKGRGYFEFPPWVQIKIRDINNPFKQVTNRAVGCINVIDLSNLATCSFIETKDLGRPVNGQKIEILGRFDNSDLRGCNLLIK